MNALRRACIAPDRIVTDHASDTREDRPGLAQLLAGVEAGDVLTVWTLDGLGRSVSHLVSVVDELGRRGIEFRSPTEALDTTTRGGRMSFHVIASAAQFERELVVERIGQRWWPRRRKADRLAGPATVNEHLIHQMASAGATQAVIAALTGISKAVAGRVLRGEIASLGRFRETPTQSPTTVQGVVIMSISPEESRRRAEDACSVGWAA